MARVLVTEDSETIREVMKDMLIEAGHTIVGEATDGAKAVELFGQLRPDITTLDIAMPVMDGMEALEKIMEIDPDAKILMVSSVSRDGNIPKSMIMGACEFIEKPFKRDDFLAVISKIEKSISSSNP